MPPHGERPFTVFARGTLSAAGQNPVMDAITAIAQSGLTTASTRVQVSASNLANMDDASTTQGSGAAGSTMGGGMDNSQGHGREMRRIDS